MTTTHRRRPNSSPAPRSNQNTHRPTDRVIEIVDQLANTMQVAISEIREVNENAKLLALNARIEAARAGSTGAAFGVVAQEMQGLSNRTAGIADEMASETRRSISELVKTIAGNVRGDRLADIALGSIDLVDRNLYERTCDVRWWATDPSFVDALTACDKAKTENAIQRMGVILSAYTVYLDLVLCDCDGNIIANGRPNRYATQGENVSNDTWFISAMRTRSGEEFASESPRMSELVGGHSAAIYATAVRINGETRGRPIGVLGVILDWESLSSAILNSNAIDDSESAITRRFFLDENGSILAASSTTSPNYRFPLQKFDKLLRMKKGYALETIDGTSCCIAHALSPGFETYATNWHSIVIQEMD